MALVTESDVFDYLDAPPERVTGADVPMPYAANLEKAALPQVRTQVVQGGSWLCVWWGVVGGWMDWFDSIIARARPFFHFNDPSPAPQPPRTLCTDRPHRRRGEADDLP